MVNIHKLQEGVCIVDSLAAYCRLLAVGAAAVQFPALPIPIEKIMLQSPSEPSEDASDHSASDSSSDSSSISAVDDSFPRCEFSFEVRLG